MRAMAAQSAELFLPAHGFPIEGCDRIRGVLTEVAEALEFLVKETVDRMNAGMRLTDIVEEVQVDPAILEKPLLKPTYDEPEFIVRNIWRQFGGWYDGNPAHLKPATDRGIALKVAELAGGAEHLAERGLTLMEAEPRLACHLVEMAMLAEPERKSIHAARAAVYQDCRGVETSLMAKGIYGSAANESKSKSED